MDRVAHVVANCSVIWPAWLSQWLDWLEGLLGSGTRVKPVFGNGYGKGGCFGMSRG